MAGCTLPGAPPLAFADAEEDSAPPPPPGLQPLPSAFDFDVPFRGEPSAIKPFLGRASILVNVKFDDPETLEALPGLKKLLSAFAADGLHVLAFPTDQGWFEPDDRPHPSSSNRSTTLANTRRRPYSPSQTSARSSCRTHGSRRRCSIHVSAIRPRLRKVFIDASGQPLRRYPRKYPVELMEDVAAASRASRFACNRHACQGVGRT